MNLQIETTKEIHNEVQRKFAMVVESPEAKQEFMDMKDKQWVSLESLKELISFQEIDENGSLIKGLCKKDIDYLLKALKECDKEETE